MGGTAPRGRQRPILEKETVRAAPEAFVADDCNPRRMLHEQTSGTTGKPLHIWRSRETVGALYALSVARTRGWHGLTRRERWAMLGGQLIVPAAQQRPPFWVWNAALHQLYMSSYHLAPDLVPQYLDALARYRIEYLVGYTSSLYALAQEVLRSGRTDLRIRLAITSAEPVPAAERETIAAAFRCPVRETYGMGETVAAASECEHGTLHQWPEVGVIEVRDGAGAIPAGSSGELVCTGLLNADMPLIRYRVGDSGRLAADDVPCPCGRPLPSIAGLDGRTNDLLLTRDGRRVAWVNPVFYGLPVRQGQIVQESFDLVRVRYAPAPEFSADTGATITQRLHERLGPITVVLDAVTDIPRGANGKFRAVVCAIPPAERIAQQARRAAGVA